MNPYRKLFFMPAKKLRKISIAAIFALVATLFQGASLSPASAAPVYSGSVSVTRAYDSDTNSIQAYSGERLYVNFRYDVNVTSVESGDELTFDDLENEITGLSAQWNINNNYMNRVTALTYTVPDPKPTSIELTVSKTLTPSANGPIKFDPVVTTDGATLTANSTYTSASLNTSITSAGYTAKDGDQYLYYYGSVCVDMAQVAADDELVLSTTITGSPTTTSNTTSWYGPNGMSINAISPQTDLERTVPSPEPTQISASFNRGFSGLTSGFKYTFSAEIESEGTSVGITCPLLPGPTPGLFPVGGASVTGTFSVGSKITVTPNKWSLTNGGAVVAAATTEYDWYLCTTPLTAATTDFTQIECFQDQPEQVLASGTSIGYTDGPNQGFTGASLTITQGLLTSMTGKYLMVIVNGASGSGMSLKRGDLFMKTCGPIASGSTCSSTYGTPVAPAKKTPKAATVATKVKVGKTFTISLHSSKGTASKGANSDGLAAVVSVASASKAFCSVTKIVKSKKITGYTVKGLKAGKCSVVVAISGSSTFNASSKTTVVTVSK